MRSSFKKRSEFIAEFIPTFPSLFYSYISQDKEKVNLAYESHAMSGGIAGYYQGEPSARPCNGIFVEGSS